MFLFWNHIYFYSITIPISGYTYVKLIIATVRLFEFPFKNPVCNKYEKYKGIILNTIILIPFGCIYYLLFNFAHQKLVRLSFYLSNNLKLLNGSCVLLNTFF